MKTKKFESASPVFLAGDSKPIFSCASQYRPPVVIGVDWNRSQVDVYDARHDTYVEYRNLEEMLPNYANLHIAMEATVESYELDRRNRAISLAKSLGITIWVFNTKYTAAARMSKIVSDINPVKISKSDKNDAKIIWHVAANTGIALHRLQPLLETDPLRTEIESEVIKSRVLEEEHKDVADRYINKLKNLNSDYVLGSGKKPRKQVLRLILVAEKVRASGRGFREYRRLIGDYANGYKSILRSEFYWWWVRSVLNGALKKAGIKKSYKQRVLDRATSKPIKIRQWSEKEISIRREVMRECHRVLKSLWRITAEVSQ